MHTTGEPILQAQTSMEGEQQHRPRRQLHLRRSPTEPRTATRAKDLRSEGRRQHHARTIAARVSSRNPVRADGSAGRPEASASCPPRTPARLMASATRLWRWSRQWTARPGSGRRSLFSSQLCLCPCLHCCLRLRLIAERPRVPLTKQEKPRAARPTEPRDSYASGIRIPHSSPSHEATHTWLSSLVSRQASPSARNEENTRYYTQKYLHVQAPTATMNRHRHPRCHYKRNSGSTPAGTNNPHIGGPAGRRNPRWLTAARSGSSDNDLRSRWPNNSSDGLRANAATTRPSPTSPLEGQGQAIKAKEPEARSADGGGDPVDDEDFFSHHHLRANDGSHLPTGRSPLGSSRAGEHRPPRRGVVPEQRQDNPRTRTPP
jgi:hypothetical protein